MECTCDISCGEGDPVRMIDDSEQISLPGQFCGECRREMSSGTIYRRMTYNFEGYHCVHRVCKDCESLVSNVVDDWLFGYIWDSIEEYLGEGDNIPERCISKITPGARDMLCDLKQKVWGELEENGYYDE